MSKPKGKLAVVIATKNNIRTIDECLNSVAGLYDSLVVIDSGSTDKTVEQCIKKGAKVIEHKWLGMVKQRQLCLNTCRDFQWILVLDSDESIDETLFSHIDKVINSDDGQFDGYQFNRKVWFLGDWLHYTFQPEYRLRLVRGGIGQVSGVGPGGKGGHDRISVPGKVGRLTGTCKHDSWVDVTDMMQRYVELGRRSAKYDGKLSNRTKLIVSPLFGFFKQYVLKQGYRDGYRGLIASLGFSCGVLIKHLLKNEKQLVAKNKDNIDENDLANTAPPPLPAANLKRSVDRRVFSK